ncbi:MAG: hypothetical protein KatS3mg021_1711 [Fimbriimonadales bacterium]|nr:MAG: hypothetical protein KatS3mg021_1711 [Fimbriimonadales bacterium]
MEGDKARFDLARIWLYHERLSAIPEEMGMVLEYAACSPNIKERRDYSCALFDERGRLIAQAAHIPVHLGAMPALMEWLLPRIEWREGDMVLTNDPYQAGHAPARLDADRAGVRGGRMRGLRGEPRAPCRYGRRNPPARCRWRAKFLKKACASRL